MTDNSSAYRTCYHCKKTKHEDEFDTTFIVTCIKCVRNTQGIEFQRPKPENGELTTPLLVEWIEEQAEKRIIDFKLADYAINGVQSRDQWGRKKYGDGLRVNSREDMVKEAEEEILDTLQYVYAAKEKGQDTERLNQLAQLLVILTGHKWKPTLVPLDTPSEGFKGMNVKMRAVFKPSIWINKTIPFIDQEMKVDQAIDWKKGSTDTLVTKPRDFPLDTEFPCEPEKDTVLLADECNVCGKRGHAKCYPETAARFMDQVLDPNNNTYH